MDELRIFTKIHSHYQVFDASGQLPFSIVFSFCRRSATDTDPRSLILDTSGSVLDVPYALARGLLTLQEQDLEDTEKWVESDISGLSGVTAKRAEYLPLPSLVNRTLHWRDALTVYRYNFIVDGEMASILKPGKKYVIRLAGEDLGVKWWAYDDQKQLVDNDRGPDHHFHIPRLVNSKPTAGNAAFTVVETLSWPPKVETRMHFCSSSLSPDPTLDKLQIEPTLEVSVTNTGSESIIVQTKGHQRVLIPWGPFQPEPDAADDRMRIIHATPHKPPTSSLQVVGPITGKVVRDNKQHGTGPLTDSGADRQPKAEDVVTLRPGVPLIRKIDIRALVNGLAEGQYKIRMQPRSCWWQRGEVVKEGDEDGRVLVHSSTGSNIPPLWLESQDEVEFHVEDGKVDQIM